MSWNLWNIASSAQAYATQGLDKVYEILEPPKIESDDEGQDPQAASPELAEEKSKEKLNEKEKEEKDPIDGEGSEEKPKEEAGSIQQGLFSSWNTMIGMATDLKNQEFVKESVGFGEILLNSTLATLETVGKNTMESVIHVVNEGRTRDKIQGASDPATEDLGSLVLHYSKEFEDRSGAAHLAAIGAISAECTSRVKGITQSLSASEAHAAVKKQVEKDAKGISAFFNIENASEEVEQSTEIQILADSGFTELQSKLQTLELQSLNQLKELQALAQSSTSTLSELTTKFKKDLDQLTTATSAEPEDKIAAILKHSLKAIQAHSVISLAKFSSKSLEMMLRLCETLLLKISERRVSTSEKPTYPLDPLAVTKLLREITVFLLKENYSLVSLHIKAIEKLSAEGKPHLDQCLEEFETEEGNVTNTIFVDIGDAIAFLQEGLQHLQPIVKMMHYEEATRKVLQPAVSSPVTTSSPVVETKAAEPVESKPSPVTPSAPQPKEEPIKVPEPEAKPETKEPKEPEPEEPKEPESEEPKEPEPEEAKEPEQPVPQEEKPKSQPGKPASTPAKTTKTGGGGEGSKTSQIPRASNSTARSSRPPQKLGQKVNSKESH